MGIFSKIKDAIFGGKAQAAPAAAPVAAAPVAAAPSAPVEIAPSAIDAVDVAVILDNLVDVKGVPSNWRTSIVDLMKLLDLDSSLDNRKELATELGFTGDQNDSASMNIWLHKEVMKQLAASGGIVPAGLAD
jgi:3-oxoacyl-ACP reductase-like protein